eukprot:1353770-Rhodomonas_salina.2
MKEAGGKGGCEGTGTWWRASAWAAATVTANTTLCSARRSERESAGQRARAGSQARLSSTARGGTRRAAATASPSRPSSTLPSSPDTDTDSCPLTVRASKMGGPWFGQRAAEGHWQGQAEAGVGEREQRDGRGMAEARAVAAGRCEARGREVSGEARRRG